MLRLTMMAVVAIFLVACSFAPAVTPRIIDATPEPPTIVTPPPAVTPRIIDATPEPPTIVTLPPAPQVSRSQENAIKSAESYLRYS